MKVIFIENEDINRGSSGGIMSYLLTMSSYIKDYGWKTALIGCGVNKKKQVKGEFSFFLSIANNSSISNFQFFLRLFINRELNLIEKDDVLHVQRPEMVIPLFFRKKNKIICTLHGGQDLAVKKKKGKIFGLVYSILQFISFVIVDQLIVVDKENMNRYLRKYPWIKKKISLISISIDTSKFHPKNKIKLRKKFSLPQDENIILFVGRLEYEKNVKFIIESFNEFDIQDCKLVIVGTGSLLSGLKKLALPNEDNIIFLGELSNALIPDIINCADVLVLSSFFEGSPTVVKEALCCDVPVISTNVGDVKDVIDLVGGGEIINLSTKSFLTAISRVFSNQKKINRKASFLFNSDIMGKKTIDVYKKI